MLTSFVSRTIFINILGITYLGVNGLFVNVLGVLSFAELGIGTAMNYSLYKPVSDNDIEKIKSLMNFYKIAYRIIALIVTVIGLSILPFLKYIVKDPGDIENRFADKIDKESDKKVVDFYLHKTLNVLANVSIYKFVRLF